MNKELSRINRTERRILRTISQRNDMLKASFKTGPGVNCAPAAEHQLMQSRRAIQWLGQTTTCSHMVQHFEVRSCLVRLLSQRGDLPHENAEGPDVALGREDTID